MKVDPKRAASCLGKVPHADRKRAERAAAAQRRRRGDELEAYRCRYCGKWHVGHSR